MFSQPKILLLSLCLFLLESPCVSNSVEVVKIVVVRGDAIFQRFNNRFLLAKPLSLSIRIVVELFIFW